MIPVIAFDWAKADLARFLDGCRGMNLDSLAGDFSRCRFLLGTTAGEGVFTAHAVSARPQARRSPTRRVLRPDCSGGSARVFWQRSA